MLHLKAGWGPVLLDLETQADPPDLLYVSYPLGSSVVNEPQGVVHSPDHRVALYVRVDALSENLRALVLHELGPLGE